MAKSITVRVVRGVLVLVFVAGAVALASRVAHRPLRTPMDGPPSAPTTTSQQRIGADEAHRETLGHAAIEDHGRFRVGIVEFDDQGRFWSRGQYDQVIADLRRVYDENNGVQTLVFAHGWKHSADVCDPNLACYRDLLASFGEQEGDSGRAVYGIYIGWRGLSISAPGLEELTFWSRKETAHRIGNGDVVELLATLEAIHRREREQSPNTRLTTIGHSFGGAVVYSALSGSLKERLATHIATPPDRRRLFAGFGTLTVLVNPAFEATRYDSIDRMLALSAGAFDVRNPRVLVTVASEGDTATQYAFPAGRWLSTLFQSSRDRDQTSQMLRTVGNYTAFATHRLDAPSGTGGAEDAGEQGGCLCSINTSQATSTDAALAMQAPASGEEEFFGNTRLTTLADNPQARSPMIVVRADRGVIADHNDIWSPRFVDFLSSLITRTDALLAR
jgi:alpha-beta hydrolase superfamily lysophospholipase